MNQPPCKSLSCFGKLECVFPKGDDGLRHTPQQCLPCPEKVECLRTAVASEDGRIVREEKLDREYAAGHIGFVERWSRKKGFRQRQQRQSKWTKWLRYFRNYRLLLFSFDEAEILA